MSLLESLMTGMMTLAQLAAHATNHHWRNIFPKKEKKNTPSRESSVLTNMLQPLPLLAYGDSEEKYKLARECPRLERW